MITIFGQHNCGQCETAKMMLDKAGIDYDYVRTIMPIPGVEYPQIFINDEELSYQEFLRRMKNGEIK